MARYAVLIDSCALVPVALADTLLRVAEQGLFRPLWSAVIIEETLDAIVEVHPTLARDAVQRRFEAMNRHFPDALVEGWERLASTVELPDPDDRHVVAAAVRGRADAIVTANLRDFPDSALEPLGIAVVHPDDFLLDQFDLAPRVVLEVIEEQAAHCRRPPLTPRDLVARLARAGAPTFADEVSRLV